MTTIQDTVTYADGTVAEGAIVLTWPPFVAAVGTSVMGGQQAFVIAPDGTISIRCFPTSNALPQPVYYIASYRLNKGPVYDEYWVVPPLPVVSIGAIRTIPEMPQNQ